MYVYAIYSFFFISITRPIFNAYVYFCVFVRYIQMRVYNIYEYVCFKYVYLFIQSDRQTGSDR